MDDLSLETCHENFGEFLREQWEVCILMGCFCRKYVMFGLKKYRGVMCDDTEERCKILEKNDLRY